MPADPVTSFVAHYDPPQDHEQWNRRAIMCWLTDAQKRGVRAEVLEVLEPAAEGREVVAIVEVAGQQYDIAHLGRGTEVQARPR